jgi:D-alanyl-D-alanine carboxypeptidase
MTLLIVAEKANMSDKVTVDSSMISSIPSDATIAYFQHGEETTIETLFMSSYLMSANDAAHILASHVGGSIDGFAQMMNERAKELGCKNTHFVNPTGLYDAEHYTTANDMAIIAKAFYNIETVKKYISKQEFTIPSSPMRPDPFPIANANALMKKDSMHYYPSVVFGKTGYTDGSKFTIVSIARKDNRNLMMVAFSAEVKSDMYNDAKKLFDYGFGDFYSLTITKTELENLFSGKRREFISAKTDVKLTIPSNVPRDSIRKSVESVDNEAYLTVKGDGYDYSKKVADVQKKKGVTSFFSGIFGFVWWLILTILKLILWIVVIAAALYILLAIYVNTIKKKRRQKNKK